MKRIAFDVMGNDKGLAAAVDAVNTFVQEHDDFHFTLVGSKTAITKHLVPHPHVVIRDAKAIATGTTNLKAIRDPDTSMYQAVHLVQTGAADIVISSGDSALYLALATLNLKRLRDVKRPAFMPVFPTTIKGKRFVMADVGANLETTAPMLVQWAKIGIVFAQKILGVPRPVVAVVNIGHEPYKGKAFHTAAYTKLANDPTINFRGFIEPRELLEGVADVVVTDGYAGNMILKTMEGSMLTLFRVLKTALASKARYKLGALLAQNAFRDLKTDFDYRNVALAWVIGLNSLVVKCHGNADRVSYLGAFWQIKVALDSGLADAFRGGSYE